MQSLRSAIKQSMPGAGPEAAPIAVSPAMRERWPDIDRIMALTEADLRSLAEKGECQCGDAGYITFDLPAAHPAFGKSFPCSCRAAEVKAARLARYYDDAEVPELYRELSFDTFAALPQQGKQAALDAARMMGDVAAYDAAQGLVLNRIRAAGLLLFGPCGTGKSGLSVAVVTAWKEAGRSALWITWLHLVRKIQSTYDRHYDHDPRVRAAAAKDIPTRDKLVAAAQHAELLVIDDFGDMERSAASSDERDIAYQIIDFRHGRDLPTLITTNLAPDHNNKIVDLNAYFGLRVVRRLRELCHYVGVGGVDIETWKKRKVS